MTQMSRTYNDIEAVTTLLDEKEKDLELAAQIGKSLLDRNRELQQRNEFLEEQLSTTTETVTQLEHELTQKIDLIHIFSETENDSGASTPYHRNDGVVGELEQKISLLENQNVTLKLEASHLKGLTRNLEEKEQQLVTDCVKQLETSNRQFGNVQKELAEKSEELSTAQTESRKFLKELVDQQSVSRKLALENEDLGIQLQAAQETQSELAQEILELQDRYAEIMAILHEAQEELRFYRKGPNTTLRSGSPLADSLYDSLASELEASDSGFYTTPNTSARVTDEESCGEPWKSMAISKPKHVTTTLLGTERVSEELRRSIICDTIPEDPVTPPELDLPVGPSFPPEERGHSRTPVPSPRSKEGSPRPLSDASSESPRESSAMSELRFGTLSHAPSTDSLASYAGPGLGEPGLPGTRDLEYCVRRLALRRKVELDYQKFRREKGYSRMKAPGAQSIESKPAQSHPSGGTTSDFRPSPLMESNCAMASTPAKGYIHHHAQYSDLHESSHLLGKWRAMASSNLFAPSLTTRDGSKGIRSRSVHLQQANCSQGPSTSKTHDTILPESVKPKTSVNIPKSSSSERSSTKISSEEKNAKGSSGAIYSKSDASKSDCAQSVAGGSTGGHNTSIVWAGGKNLMWPGKQPTTPSIFRSLDPVGIGVIFEEEGGQSDSSFDMVGKAGIYTRAALQLQSPEELEPSDKELD